MALYDPSGTMIAFITGKFTSYDSYCYIRQRGANDNGDAKVDMRTGRVSHDGFFIDNYAIYREQIAAYKKLCRQYMGYAKLHQVECDAAYEALKTEAITYGFTFNVKHIALGDDPVKGGLQAMASLLTGLDVESE